MSKKPRKKIAPVVETKPIEWLKPNPKNSRTHTDAQLQKIAKSIKQFGFVAPVIADPKGSVIAGHGRLEAAKSLGMSELPVLIIAHLTEAQKRAYLIADNRIALDAGWNFDLLNAELSALKLENFEVDLLGFDLPELNNLLGSFAPVAPGKTDAKAAWQGMPAFEHQDEMPHRTIYLHFRSDEAVEEFAKLLDYSITDKTKSLWFPKPKPEDKKITVDKIYDVDQIES